MWLRAFFISIVVSLATDAAMDSKETTYVDECLQSTRPSGVGGPSITLQFPFHPILGITRFSFFFPILDTEKHHVYWDTQTVILSTLVGYRNTPARLLLKNKWLFGGYLHWEHIAEYDRYRGHMGFEMVSDHLGKLLINGHKMLFLNPSAISKQWHQRKWLGYKTKASMVSPLVRLDNGGVHAKWSYPLLKQLQGSITVGYASIWNRETALILEDVWSFGVGFQYTASKNIIVQMNYVVIDKYRKNHIEAKIRCGHGDSNLGKSLVETCLKKPPDIIAPLYMPSVIITVNDDDECQWAVKYSEYVPQDIYEILRWSQGELKKNYRKEVLKIHPDKKAGSQETFKRFQAIYEALMYQKSKKAK